MVTAAGKYADVRAPQTRAGSSTPARAFNLIVPKPGECVSLPEWYWREMREGGLLQQYIAREKAVTLPRQIGETARRERNFVQNKKSEFRRLASIPARLFFRMQGEDPDFWSDPKNIKSLKRDNPDLAIWL